MFPMFAGAGPNPSNAVYRAYRIPYGWIPQLTKPDRAAPDPASTRRVQSVGLGCSESVAGRRRLGPPSGWARRWRRRPSASRCEASRFRAVVGRGRERRAGALPRRRRRSRRSTPARTARPINFRVVLPASWNRRAAQLGGGGMNGIMPEPDRRRARRAGPSLLERGFATYGSDSGHQAGVRCARRRRRGGRRARTSRTTGRSTTRRSGTSATCR